MTYTIKCSIFDESVLIQVISTFRAGLRKWSRYLCNVFLKHSRWHQEGSLSMIGGGCPRLQVSYLSPAASEMLENDLVSQISSDEAEVFSRKCKDEREWPAI